MVNNFAFYSVKHRLLVFKLNNYTNVIEENLFKYIDEWGLLTPDYKIPNKVKYFEDYLVSSIKEHVFLFKIAQKSLNSKGIIIYNPNMISNFTNKFENYNKFTSKVKSIVKKMYKNTYFTELQFNKVTGLYLNYQCIELNGEEIEFLQKNNLTL
jgi:hypothetical protein